MARSARPRVIDFTHVCMPEEERQADAEYQAQLKAIRGGTPGVLHPLEMKGSTRYFIGKDGRLGYHTRPVPEWRMRRARRILWECRQRDDWAYRQHSFFRHPSLRNVPYPVLKQLIKESEER